MPEKFKLKIEEKIETLPEEAQERLREHAREGSIEDFFVEMKLYGLPLSTQVEIASHFFKDLQEGIHLIGWTKKRLWYFEELLKRTISNEEDPNVTSARNLLKNYLVCTKVFEDKEGKLPRFGQFRYAMEIFRGVTSNEEISQRINEHRTFGEQAPLTEKDQQAIADAIDQASSQVDEAFAQAEKPRKEIKKNWKDGVEQEERQKGTTWSSTYSPPKLYTFPHYTFQTGTLKGQNTALGRSSWEPLFLAFTDVANKKMEDAIEADQSLSDEERRERIKNRRIELFYEEFDFPVGIRVKKDGESEPVIYRLDFIDFNRWRAIEVKGPLKPEAKEKTRLFKKYYVDGDFSDLPDDKKILMISYVEETLEKLRTFCQERGFPVFPRFSSITVLGAHRWDWKLGGNFNKYTRVDEMPGVPPRTKSRLKKGFFKFVEEKIKKEELPDIRPEKYKSTDTLPETMDLLKNEAKKSGERYEVVKPYDLKPYLPRAFLKSLKWPTEKSEIRTFFNQAYSATIQYSLETLPIATQTRELVLTAETLKDELKTFLDLLDEAITDESLRNDMYLPEEDRFEIPLPPHFDVADFLSRLERFRKYLLDLSKNLGGDVAIEKEYRAENFTGYLKSLIEFTQRCFRKNLNILSIPSGYLANPSGFYLTDEHLVLTMFRRYTNYLLGKHSKVFLRRADYITAEVSKKVQKDFWSGHDVLEELFEAFQKETEIRDYEFKLFCTLLAEEANAEFKFPDIVENVLAAAFYLEEAGGRSLPDRLAQIVDASYSMFEKNKGVFKELASFSRRGTAAEEFQELVGLMENAILSAGISSDDNKEKFRGLMSLLPDFLDCLLRYFAKEN